MVNECQYRSNEEVCYKNNSGSTTNQDGLCIVVFQDNCYNYQEGSFQEWSNKERMRMVNCEDCGQ